MHQFAALVLGQNVFKCAAAGSLSPKRGDMLKSLCGDMSKLLFIYLTKKFMQGIGWRGCVALWIAY